MNKIFIVLLSFCAYIFAENGTVKYAPSGCDWFIIETNQGMVLLEMYGGNEPAIGNTIIGELSGFGLCTLFNITADRDLRAWEDDYMLSKENNQISWTQ
jgi:hypothetical protein